MNDFLPQKEQIIPSQVKDKACSLRLRNGCETNRAKCGCHLRPTHSGDMSPTATMPDHIRCTPDAVTAGSVIAPLTELQYQVKDRSDIGTLAVGPSRGSSREAPLRPWGVKGSGGSDVTGERGT